MGKGGKRKGGTEKKVFKTWKSCQIGNPLKGAEGGRGLTVKGEKGGEGKGERGNRGERGDIK